MFSVQLWEGRSSRRSNLRSKVILRSPSIVSDILQTIYQRLTLKAVQVRTHEAKGVVHREELLLNSETGWRLGEGESVIFVARLFTMMVTHGVKGLEIDVLLNLAWCMMMWWKGWMLVVFARCDSLLFVLEARQECCFPCLTGGLELQLNVFVVSWIHSMCGKCLKCCSWRELEWGF